MATRIEILADRLKTECSLNLDKAALAIIDGAISEAEEDAAENANRDEIREAENRAEAAEEELSGVTKALDDIFEAACAAAEGIPDSGKWIVDHIQRNAPSGDRLSEAAARGLAKSRPRDFYTFG